MSQKRAARSPPRSLEWLQRSGQRGLWSSQSGARRALYKTSSRAEMFSCSVELEDGLMEQEYCGQLAVDRTEAQGRPGTWLAGKAAGPGEAFSHQQLEQQQYLTGKAEVAQPPLSTGRSHTLPAPLSSKGREQVDQITSSPYSNPEGSTDK
ncbi:hypothetical protein UY3_08806 [Chelonia mydas]|uniref:Uncharacterized protein n=1 Tax=Chelonia mydas TaxID=8469 RepID=M7BEQ3_CHEMY|nr:hypothetical protein UY3_08806 [Chelonia mydas]